MTVQEIKTPRGRVYQGPYGKAILEWDTNFRQSWLVKYSGAQRFVDSECLRLCEPYVPLKTGMLIKSGILGTEVGSGTVQYIAPYARHQYYLKRKTKSETGPLRGSYWFQRMKEVHGRKILEGARRIMRSSQ